MSVDDYITIPKLASLLGVSRIAIYKRVKKGQIPATKVGGIYVITDRTVTNILGKKMTAKGKRRTVTNVLGKKMTAKGKRRTVTNVLGKKMTAKGKRRIDAAVRKTLREYGEVLKKLGSER